MNDIEQECIILNAAWIMIDDMVNWAMFVNKHSDAPTSLMFESSQHARLFNILLGDFLSQLSAFKGKSIPLGLSAVPSNAQQSDLTFLFHLRQVCRNPLLNDRASELTQAVEAFAAWLEQDIKVEGVNFPNIDVVADIRVSRLRYLKICGDVAKHNLARLSGNVTHIRRLLDESGHPVEEFEGFLAVENFFEWFHTNIFIYHSSVIADFLNNIRLAIDTYLASEFSRSHHFTEPEYQGFRMYNYRYPDGCDDAFARAMYWDLMNRVRSKPWMPKFDIHASFRSQY
jgi:hypothetical protein